MAKFIKGMDLSTLRELERCGAKYYEDGKEKDILDIMRDHDVDTILSPRTESLTVPETMIWLRLSPSERKLRMRDSECF